MPRFPLLSPTSHGLSDKVFGSLVTRARESGRHVYPLHVGDTHRVPPECARAEMQRVAETPKLHNYAVVQGEPALISAIVDKLDARTGVRVDPANVQVMAGGTSGLSIVAETLFDAGEEILLPSPFWPLIRGVFRSRGLVPVEIPFYDRMHEPGFDAEALLEAHVTPKTTGLYVNSPHNPTGRIVPRAIVDAIVRVAKRHDLWVLSDEAYEDLWYTKEAPEPIWARADLRDRVLAGHTLSKSYGLAGARVGYVHGPREAMEAIRGVQTFQTYCAPKPMQLGAARAIREAEAWIHEARTLYARMGARAADALRVETPQGGTFLFFDVRPHLREGEDVMGWLTRAVDAGVLLTPGSASGRHYETHARLCYTCVPEHELDEALTCLRAVLRER